MLIFLFSILLSFAYHGVEGTPCEGFFLPPPVAPRVQVLSKTIEISTEVKDRMEFYLRFKSCYDWAKTQKKDLIVKKSKKKLWRNFINESDLKIVIFSVEDKENSDQIGLLEQKESILRSPSGVPAIMVFAALNGISWYMAAKIDRECELEIERLGGHGLAMQNGYYPECGVQEVYVFEDMALTGFSVFQKMNFLSRFKFKSIVDFENTKVIAEVLAEGSETLVKDTTRFKDLVNSFSNFARKLGIKTKEGIKKLAGLKQQKQALEGLEGAAKHELYKKHLRQNMPKPDVQDVKLKKIVNNLYKPNAKVGSGSTADALRYEKLNSGTVGG